MVITFLKHFAFAPVLEPIPLFSTSSTDRPSGMRSILFLSCLAAASTAAPIFEDFYDFSNDMAELLGRVSKRISSAADIFDPSFSCDASSIALPPFASELPTPKGTPLYVALGRGTQVGSPSLYSTTTDKYRTTPAPTHPPPLNPKPSAPSPASTTQPASLPTSPT